MIDFINNVEISINSKNARADLDNIYVYDSIKLFS